MRRMINFMAGAFCGALVGSVAALLLAPYAGEDLRERATQRFGSLRDEMNTAYRARRQQLEHELASMREGEETA
ncbi:MAG: YtxH domain-containing protein [Anaerolineales bacterium]